jgi:hypothetical protein
MAAPRPPSLRGPNAADRNAECAGLGEEE